MTLNEMRQLLADRGIQLTKSLGQNFMHDANQLRRIVEAADLQPGDKVLEIGPGLGPLTELLLEQAGEVLAIEMDARLAQVLRDRFAARLVAVPTTDAASGGTPGLHLLRDDALAFLRREPRDWSAWKLVANLPYSMASTLLVDLAQLPQPPERVTVTLQLEVAQRLMAQTNDDDYGILTLLAQLRYTPVGMFKIPPECFFPVPDVTSACVTLRRRNQPLLPPEETRAFSRLVKIAFSQRRKMMAKLLRQAWPRETVEAVFATMKLDLQIRAEKVSLEQFVRLTTLLGVAGGKAEL
jgi:16S rRNA (adenine1518-N6/adenine1519-N6)-dimethyltransferase